MGNYEDALKAAGAEVHAYESFGSYQGDWYALVTYNGERGWIHGWYGSCSGCDAFEGEFGWTEGRCDEHSWVADKEREGCAACASAEAEYQRRLADFGKTYLDGLQQSGVILAELQERFEWDSDSKEAADWIRAQA